MAEYKNALTCDVCGIINRDVDRSWVDEADRHEEQNLGHFVIIGLIKVEDNG